MDGDLVALYRVVDADDPCSPTSSTRLAAARGGVRVNYVVGDHTTVEGRAPALPRRICGELVPDIAERDVYICGPAAMTHEIVRTLRTRKSCAQITYHVERFAITLDKLSVGCVCSSISHHLRSASCWPSARNAGCSSFGSSRRLRRDEEEDNGHDRSSDRAVHRKCHQWGLRFRSRCGVQKTTTTVVTTVNGDKPDRLDQDHLRFVYPTHTAERQTTSNEQALPLL